MSRPLEASGLRLYVHICALTYIQYIHIRTYNRKERTNTLLPYAKVLCLITFKKCLCLALCLLASFSFLMEFCGHLDPIHTWWTGDSTVCWRIRFLHDQKGIFPLEMWSGLCCKARTCRVRRGQSRPPHLVKVRARARTRKNFITWRFYWLTSVTWNHYFS